MSPKTVTNVFTTAATNMSMQLLGSSKIPAGDTYGRSWLTSSISIRERRSIDPIWVIGRSNGNQRAR